MREIVREEKEGEILVDEIEKLNKDKYFGGLYNIEEQQKKIEESLKEEYFNEGVEEGSHQEKLAIAKSMLQENISINIIIKCTGLTEEEIEMLK